MAMSIFDFSKRFELFPKHGSATKLSNSAGDTSTGKRSGVFSNQPKLTKLGGLYVNTRGDSSSG